MSGVKEVSFDGGVKSSAQEIKLMEWIDVLRRRAWIVAVFALFSLALGVYAYSQPIIPLYQTETRFMLRITNMDAMGTFLGFIREPVVMESVIEDLELPMSVQGLRSKISVGSSSTSQIANVSIVDTDPQRAAVIANEVMIAYKRALSTYMGWSDIVILTPAEANPYPINSKSPTSLILSLLIGMILGIVGAFFLESLDHSVRSKQDLALLLNVPVLGQVAKIREKDIAMIDQRKDVSVAVRGETIGS